MIDPSLVEKALKKNGIAEQTVKRIVVKLQKGQKNERNHQQKTGYKKTTV